MYLYSIIRVKVIDTSFEAQFFFEFGSFGSVKLCVLNIQTFSLHRSVGVELENMVELSGKDDPFQHGFPNVVFFIPAIVVCGLAGKLNFI